MGFNPFTDTSQDGLSADEIQIYNDLVSYRQSLGLHTNFQVSVSLNAVAGRHAADMVENLGGLTHSWSWGTYDKNDPSTYHVTWNAPQTIGTAYPGYGFENALYGANADAAANAAIDGWAASPGHNAVMTNTSGWEAWNWTSVGIGVYKNAAVLWFGQDVDPAGYLPLHATEIRVRLRPEFFQTVTGTAGDDTIAWNTKINYSGRNGNDNITGSGSDDILYGNIGLDRLIGGGGQDTIYGGQNGGTMTMGEGDAPAYRQGVETIEGGDGLDILYGNHGSDILLGGADSDTLYGGQDDDTLSGGAGPDRLFGNRGNDVLVGGSGADTFSATGSGTDTVLDFNAAEGDRIATNGTYSLSTAADGSLQVTSGNATLKLQGVSAVDASSIDGSASQGARPQDATPSTQAFDAPDYLAANPDVFDAVGWNMAAAEEHFLRFGAAEGRPTEFDEEAYLLLNPDVAAAVSGRTDGAEWHYAHHGHDEGRQVTSDPLLVNSDWI